MTSFEPLFVQVIADYGSADDMAFAEVRQALRYVLRDKAAQVDILSVPVFDTYATGFVLGQLANNHPMGLNQLFYVNTAPRKDDTAARANDDGEGLAYVRLRNGVRIVAVNSGFSLSFVADQADEMRHINCSTDGSQFRSRDVFPQAFGLIAHGDESILEDDIRAHVPAIPESVVCYADGFGNLKTSIDASALKGLDGKRAIVTINGQSHEAIIGEGIFSVPEGTLVLSAGSSGWKDAKGNDRRFIECVWRGHSAAQLFGKPVGGSPVQWRVNG
jgi:hypothetical protein